jgi:hypothetical protein
MTSHGRVIELGKPDSKITIFENTAFFPGRILIRIGTV